MCTQCFNLTLPTSGKHDKHEENMCSKVDQSEILLLLWVPPIVTLNQSKIHSILRGTQGKHKGDQRKFSLNMFSPVQNSHLSKMTKV